MATTQLDHEVTAAPAFHNYGELKPYPSVLLLDYWLPEQTGSLAKLRLSALKELAESINANLATRDRISIVPDAGKKRLTSATMRERIREHLDSLRDERLLELMTAIRQVLAYEIIVDKVIWELSFDGDLEFGELKRIRRDLLDKATWPAAYAQVCETFGLDPSGFRRRAFTDSETEWEDIDHALGLATAGLWYVEHRVPGWFRPETRWLQDDLRQIVLVSVMDEYVAVYASEGRAKQRITAALGTDEVVWEDLHRVAPGTLESAFTDGPARTLWLRGTHRRTAWKPDSKILSGIDLESALDPLGDQTFYYSAARSNTWIHPTPTPAVYDPKDDDSRLSIGVAPGRSTVWAPAVPDWYDYAARVHGMVRRVEYVGAAEGDAFQALARPVRQISRNEVWGAYDMSLIAPEMLVDGALAPGTREKAERWAYEAAFFNFDPDPNDPRLNPDGRSFDGTLAHPDFSVAVALEGNYLGRISLEFDTTDMQRIGVTAKPKRWRKPTRKELAHYTCDELTARERNELLEGACWACEQTSWLTVRYDSGHTMSDRAFYSLRLRDTVFPPDQWLWRTFDKINVHKEKPSHPNQIGKEDSLFCWVWKNWPVDSPNVKQGWLACDDGPEEIADFIHFDPIEKLLTLIHVKASHSTAANRQISTSDYEVVVGQAVKNLRLLDRVDLASRLAAGKGRDAEVLKNVSHGNKRSTRAEMAKALRAAGESYRRRVVIVQPRVTVTEYTQVMADREGPDLKKRNTGRVRRLRQLDTLLLEAQAACRHLGAEFQVIGQSIQKE